MRTELLVDTPAFWGRLKQDLHSAKKRVLVKTLTFEGDTTGKRFAEALIQSPAREKKVLVDSYSLWAMSDHILFAPHNWIRPALWRERRETLHMYETLRKNGVDVRVVHPPSFNLVRLAHRDHKKLICIDDDITFIGGFNFSDHNFAWHDCMVRVKDVRVNAVFTNDFHLSWEGVNQSYSRRIDGFHFIILDGFKNEHSLYPIFKVIESARESIYIVNPYITDPFLHAFLTRARQGVNVNFLLPQHNNRTFLKQYFLYHAFTNGDRRHVQVYMYPGMIHMKAFCVDHRVLVFGSANFDFMSYRIQPEYLVIAKDMDLVQEFVHKVWEKDIHQAHRYPVYRPNLRGRMWKKVIQWFDHYLEKKKVLAYGLTGQEDGGACLGGKPKGNRKNRVIML